MKKRNIIFLSLVMALVMLLSVGCGSKTPKEILEEAVMNSAKIKTAQQKVSLDLSLDVENADPMMAGYLQMLQDINMEINIKADSDNMKTASEVTVDLGGMAYTVDFYVTPEQVAFKSPLVPQYVVQELEEDMQMDLEAKQELGAFVEEVTKAMIDNIEDDKIVNNGKKDITTPEGDLKVTEIAVELSDEEIKEIMEQVVEIMFENPQMSKYMAQGIEAALEAEGQDITDEAIEERIDEIKNEIDIAFDEMYEVLKVNDLNMTYFIDNKSNLIKSDFNFTIAIDDEESGKMAMEFSGTTEVWDINKDLQIDIPEFNDDNSISMEELVNQMFGVMPY